VAKSCCAPSAGETTNDVLAALVENREEFVAFAVRQVRDAMVAEEIVQASFAKAAARIHQLESTDSARAWFYRMLRNAAVDHRRRQSAEQRTTAAFGVEPQQDVVEAQERSPRACQCVSRAMASLKPEYQAALQRVEIEDSSVKDFAAEQGIAANNAAVRLFRAREALKKKVEAMCGTCASDGGCFDCMCAAPI